MISLPPLYCFPNPKPGVPYGPNKVHRPLFIHDMLPQNRPHNHTCDIVLLVGGAGSSKTCHAIGQVTKLVGETPMLKGVVGGKNYPLLKRNVVTEFAQRFSTQNGEYWGHPIVRKKPTQNEMVMRTIHGASLQFLNLDKYAVARGFDADLVMIEEINLMDQESFEEMIRRSRGKVLSPRQFILSMNPTGDRDWLYYKFNMRQFEPDYDGPPLPIGEPCKCQFCNVCLDSNVGAFEWVGGEKEFADYTNSEGRLYQNRCYSWKGGQCPNCGHLKEDTCPGMQYFYRVIRSRSYDNPHNPASYVQDMKASLDPETYKLFVEGQIIQLRTGKIYKSFSYNNNVLKEDVELNPVKDIIWTHDFNVDPMCSVIWQETEWGVHVVDEIVLRDANEEKVAKEFVKRYAGFEGRVLIYGDPSALYGSGRSETNRTGFQILYDYLKLHKFNVEVKVEKIPNETKIAIKDRVNDVNSMLKNAQDEVRIKINPSCEFLIQSLNSVNWDKAGKEEDKSVDETAKQSVNWQLTIPILTHPSCAFGYGIHKRFPIIRRKTALNVIITETGTVQEEAGKTTYKRNLASDPDAPLEPKKEQETNSVFDPKAMSDVLKEGGVRLSKSILNERLEKEKAENEKYLAQLEAKLAKYRK